MPELPDRPRLENFQNYVRELEAERGFSSQSVRDKCLLMGEEMGELFKAVRKREGLATDPESSVGELSGELTDIFIYLCAIANRYGIALEEAFLEKERINKQRIWKDLSS